MSSHTERKLMDEEFQAKDNLINSRKHNKLEVIKLRKRKKLETDWQTRSELKYSIKYCLNLIKRQTKQLRAYTVKKVADKVGLGFDAVHYHRNKP
jgi:hypothetical protein